MKIIPILLLLLLIIVGLDLLWMYSNGGFYIPIIDYIYCSDSVSCYHEEGHKIDAHSGWISTTYEYHIAILQYIVNNDNDLSSMFSQVLFGDYYGLNAIYMSSMSARYKEIFAHTYAWFEGKIDNIPPELNFYTLTK